MLETLPIDSLLPDIVASLRARPALLISAPPGAGKTTRVPRALCDAGFAGAGEILVLEPRRLATRLAAARVAEELGEPLGETVGYSIRFESVGGPRTRIRFLTEGVFSRRIVQDPMLRGVSTVILDEFHERHLTTDLALAYLHQLQQSRHDLKLLVMSATLETDALSSFLDNAPVLSSQGRRFEVSIEHLETKREESKLEELVTAAVAGLIRNNVDGDILVFLPGAAEIRRSMATLQRLSDPTALVTVPLHGDLTAAEQVRAVSPAETRKVILATNVAETSITIPGIGAVIDSGLARVASYSPWSGLPRLTLSKVSRASAQQRAGRAGRTQAGHVIRLYSLYDFESRPERDQPEVRRADMAETLLTLHGAGIRDAREFPWFEPPPKAALESAETLLARLGALDGSGKLTDAGRMLLRFPVHPRLARLITEGERLGVAEDAVLLAALLSERDIRPEVRSAFRETSRTHTGARGSSDLIEMLSLFRAAERTGFDRAQAFSMGLDPAAIENVARTRRQLSRLLPGQRIPHPSEPDEEALRLATLACFPDRVARRSTPTSRTLVLASGGSARLADSSIVHSGDLLVAIDAEERTGGRGSAETKAVLVRLASEIEPEWLVELFPEMVCSETRIGWNESATRVDEFRRTTYGQVVLEEKSRPAPLSEATSTMLAEKARERGLSVFSDGGNVPELMARAKLVATHLPHDRFPGIGQPELDRAIEQVCDRKRSFSELARESLLRAVLGHLTAGQRDLLSREAPEIVALPGRRTVRVHYHTAGPPWIESRLQDFWGMKKTMTICSGRVPLTIHLLAPNGRPVQVTQDVAGFWERHYPGIKRELARRYPKHKWP